MNNAGDKSLYLPELTNHYIELAGARLRYWDSGGNGPILFCSSGVGGSVELWWQQFRLATLGIRVIAWDYPGHGLSHTHQPFSSLEELAETGWQILRHLNIKNLSLVGNSMGGAVSLRMAKQNPAAVNNIILLNAAGLARDTPFPFRLMCLPGLGELMTKPGAAAFQRQIQAIFYRPKDLPANILAAIKRNTASNTNQQSFLNGVRVMNNLQGQKPAMIEESLAILRHTDKPVLVIHGKQDKVIPYIVSETARQMNKQAKVLILENCGHTPQVEMPDTINDVLLDRLTN